MQLKRTGNRPLEFEGVELTTISTKIFNGTDHNRWHEIGLYETNSGKYVVSIEYGTTWQGEMDHCTAEVFETIDEAVGSLRTYDPCAYVSNLPGYAQFNEKQERIRNELKRRYDAAVSQVLFTFPEKVE